MKRRIRRFCQNSKDDLACRTLLEEACERPRSDEERSLHCIPCSPLPRKSSVKNHPRLFRCSAASGNASSTSDTESSSLPIRIGGGDALLHAHGRCDAVERRSHSATPPSQSPSSNVSLDLMRMKHRVFCSQMKPSPGTCRDVFELKSKKRSAFFHSRWDTSPQKKGGKKHHANTVTVW
jgi:hypothetical protein